MLNRLAVGFVKVRFRIINPMKRSMWMLMALLTARAAILGITALEALGLEVDPIRNTLKEAQLLML